VRKWLRLIFVPGFNVKSGEKIYPAADLSEQISTAGKEASGTGNMKLTLNGALTIGTLDGANVEIREAVGADHFFLFGMTAEEVIARRAKGYHPGELIERDPELRGALELIGSGHFSPEEPGRFGPLVATIAYHDEFFVAADYRAYLERQAEVEEAWLDRERWTESSILNVARAGRFSSDRSIQEYAQKIWKVSPVPVTLPLSGPPTA
jgi:starch phosphorylase